MSISGKWINWKLDFILSNTGSGYIDVYKNDKKIGGIKGNTAVGSKHYWKQGIYTQSRSTGCVVQGNAVTFIKNLLIKTYSSDALVTLPPPTTTRSTTTLRSTATLTTTTPAPPKVITSKPFEIQWDTNRNLVVDNAKGMLTNGNPIRFWNRVSNDNQKWVKTKCNQIQLYNSNFCLDVTAGVAADGTPIQLWTCNSSCSNKNQVFYSTATGGIQWGSTGYCLKVKGNNNEVGTPLEISTCKDVGSQSFTLRVL